MKNTVFTGAATAIVTPMTENGVDYEAYGTPGLKCEIRSKTVT